MQFIEHVEKQTHVWYVEQTNPVIRQIVKYVPILQ